jgi:glutamate 5-kinase
MNVVAKIGTSSITDERGEISRPAIDKLAAEVATLRSQGHRVVVVTSGAIAAGLPALGLSGARPTDVATLQAISAVGQSRLMAAYDAALGQHNLVAGQVLLAPLDFMDRSQYLHARDTFGRLLDLGVVPVVNENDAVATTTTWPPSSPTSSMPTSSSCSPTPRASTTPTPASTPAHR